MFTKTQQEIERDRIERQQARERPIIPDYMPRPDVTRVVNGVEWIVAWDGA